MVWKRTLKAIGVIVAVLVSLRVVGLLATLVVPEPSPKAPRDKGHKSRDASIIQAFDTRNDAFVRNFEIVNQEIGRQIKSLAEEARPIGKSIAQTFSSKTPDERTRSEFKRYLALQCEIERLAGPDMMVWSFAQSVENHRRSYNATAAKEAAPLLLECGV